MSKPAVNSGETPKELSFVEFKEEVLKDFYIAVLSREASLLGRKEVLTGKAKFGIFGDGKEVAQIAMAKSFRKGDFRSGYYRDQTFMLASELMTVQQFFAQLYAHADQEAEPMSSGRSMNGHFATHTVNQDGSWKNLTELKNSSADISPTAGQMPRLLGLAYASKIYRNIPDLHQEERFSVLGNEVAFGTIGDASTSEGLFFETINAAGVLQVPLAISVWDDGYGISVSTKFQTTKANISKALAGFKANEDGPGYLILEGKGWDYAGLVSLYEEGIEKCRREHVPVLFHITEVTQPQGHSTSGSHERYKSKERLDWEQEFDCIVKMREWIVSSAIADDAELEELAIKAKEDVKVSKKAAWDEFMQANLLLKSEAITLIEALFIETANEQVGNLLNILKSNKEPLRRDVMEAIRGSIRAVRGLSPLSTPSKAALLAMMEEMKHLHAELFNSWLYTENEASALHIKGIEPHYEDDARMVDGREILRDNFDSILASNKHFLTFGEDSGGIGGVNQTLEGLQKKYGDLRVSDTGIREATIVGQGIGMAMRGLRPVAEIQYLDYLLYAIQIMSDDLATLRYRTKGAQKAPLIISTRGHRLEGIWHSGSPMGMIINAIRGMYVCVPRDMTRAAGFYNTLLAADDPALIIEPLNGYRIKEKQPANMGEFRIPLGIPEILTQGSDITLVTYGSCCRIAQEACRILDSMSVSVELIDVQTLLPFDREHRITESVKKTNKLVILDEDVRGGASAFILQQIMEDQRAFQFLDAEPLTITSKDHRPAYGSDGDYFSKPSVDDVVEELYQMMHVYQPQKYPSLF